MTQKPKVPDKLEDVLSPVWLSEALGQRFPGVKVTAATLGPVISRLSTNARFHIDFEGGGPGLSTDLCAKGYFTDVGWPYRQVGESEALFYREFADASGVRTLRSVYADVDPETHHGVVITEDVTATGATFLDGRSPYTPEQAAASLAQYAILHGGSWKSPVVRDATWLRSQVGSSAPTRGVAEIRGNFDGPIGAGVPDAARQAERLVEAFGAVSAIRDHQPSWCLLHGDAHVGNLMLDAEGLPWLVDWQLVQRGPWYLDVGYHIGSALAVEDRRRCEKDLLAHYFERLEPYGVAAPSADEAEFGLCCGLIYGFFLWAITLKVEPAITASLLVRLGTAVADHDAIAVVLGA